jgi:hypothetical protein
VVFLDLRPASPYSEPIITGKFQFSGGCNLSWARMRKNRQASEFTEAEIVLRQGERGDLSAIWRADAPTMKRLRQFEEENRKLKTIVADLPLDEELLRTFYAEMYGRPPLLQRLSILVDERQFAQMYLAFHEEAAIEYLI